MSEIKIKLLNDLAVMPYKTYDSDSCYDVVATSKEYLNNEHTIIKYGLGIAVDLPKFHEMELRPRSSIYKTGLILSNSPGTIDEEYTGEVMCIFYKVIDSLPEYNIGDRIAQIKFNIRNEVMLSITDNIENKTRNTNGHGSTGR